MNGGKAKSIKETESTLRFHLQLDNPTDETTNEFLYSELTSEKSRKVSIHGTSFTDRLYSTTLACETKETKAEDQLNVHDIYSLRSSF